MGNLLLVQDVFLLATDEESGKQELSVSRDGALAAALILDLADAGAIDVGEKTKVQVTDHVPDDPLLARALEVIGGDEKQRRVSEWMTRLPSKLKPFASTVGRSLVDRGILAEEPAKVLGLFNTTHWPERDPAPEQALRAELTAVLVDDAAPTARALMLIGILKNYNFVYGIVDKPDRKHARKRADELAKQAESSDELSKALGDSYRATQAAVMAAIIASTTASTTVAITSN